MQTEVAADTDFRQMIRDVGLAARSRQIAVEDPLAANGMNRMAAKHSASANVLLNDWIARTALGGVAPHPANDGPARRVQGL